MNEKKEEEIKRSAEQIMNEKKEEEIKRGSDQIMNEKKEEEIKRRSEQINNIKSVEELQQLVVPPFLEGVKNCKIGELKQRNELEKTKTEFEATKVAYEKQLKETQMAFQEQLEATQMEYKEQLGATKVKLKGKEEEIKETKQKFEEEIKGEKAKYEEEIKETKQKFEEEIKGEKAKYEGEKAKREGLYYSTISQIFSSKSVTINSEESLGRITRKSTPELYKTTKTSSEYVYQGAKPAMVQDSSMETKQKAQIFPSDIFGNESNGDVAHLIPNSPYCAIFFEDVGKWALGLSDEVEERTTTCTKRTWTVFAEKMSQAEMASKRNKAVVNGTVKKSKKNKEPNSALKQHLANKIRLNCQMTYFDMYPCLLIIPLSSLDFVLNWQEDVAYDVMVAVDGFGSDIGAKTVARAINMEPNSDNEHCGHAELVLACDLMDTALRALGASMMSKPDGHFQKAQSYKGELCHAHETLKRNGTILVPHLNEECGNVVKVSFGGSRHRPPDPLLLLVKSAIVWSVRNGQRLLPTCPPPPDDWTDMDYYFAERALEREQSQHRPKSWEDLAVGLGQYK